MKLGTQTGSVINHVLAGIQGQEPAEGMGVTILAWTDRYPGTIQTIKRVGKNSLRLLVVTEDDAKRIDKNGMSDAQSYEYKTNCLGRQWHFIEQGPRWIAAREANGRWFAIKDGERAVVGRREKYHDFSF